MPEEHIPVHPLTLLSIVCFRRFMASYPMEATLVALLSGMWLLIHAKLATDCMAPGDGA